MWLTVLHAVSAFAYRFIYTVICRSCRCRFIIGFLYRFTFSCCAMAAAAATEPCKMLYVTWVQWMCLSQLCEYTGWQLMWVPHTRWFWFQCVSSDVGIESAFYFGKRLMGVRVSSSAPSTWSMCVKMQSACTSRPWTEAQIHGSQVHLASWWI